MHTSNTLNDFMIIHFMIIHLRFHDHTFKRFHDHTLAIPIGKCVYHLDVKTNFKYDCFILANDDKDSCLFIRKVKKTFDFVVYVPIHGHMAILDKLLRKIAKKFYNNARAYGTRTASGRTRSMVLTWSQVYDFMANNCKPFQRNDYTYYNTKAKMFKKRSLSD